MFLFAGNFMLNLVHKKPYLFLWILCVLGSLATIPYLFFAGLIRVGMPIWKIAFLTALNSSVLFGLVCWLSSKILPKTDLTPFKSENPIQRIVCPGIFSGIFVGLVLFIFDKVFFSSSLLSAQHPPFWAGAIASIYGAINEEVFTRLFLLTLIYLFLGKWFTTRRRVFLLWISTFLASLLFGAGHLPALFKLAPPSSFEIVRVLFLNGIAGIVFGWLYWSRGLWTAILAHFVTDLMIHVILI
ncbi:MAG: CPBP family intramembrane metalloprotease [Chlamydiales bacterium]|nr:CPBP family intramembrane metalloprotease [Chlamydiales bacterium]